MFIGKFGETVLWDDCQNFCQKLKKNHFGGFQMTEGRKKGVEITRFIYFVFIV
jgi:hypothetical protein